jgi:conjugal transfer pilus assembly protein TraV
MAACTTFLGSNIKGSFSCSAPGGTCAPSTVIDDQALSVIQNARPMTPSGPYFQPSARRAAPDSARAPSGRGRMAATGEGMVQRERRVLKVVFPSYVDGAGNLHEPRVVHTVADEGAWMQLSSGEPNAGDQLVGRSAAPAARPDTLVDASPLPSLPPAIAVPMAVSATSQAMTATPAAAGPPDPRIVAEARARGPMRALPSPVDAIKAEVQARLAQTPKAPGSPGAVQPVLLATAAPAAAAQPAAQSAAQLPAPSAPAAPNPRAGFSGKVEE